MGSLSFILFVPKTVDVHNMDIWTSGVASPEIL